MIGKPKVGDIVKVHYIASVHGKKGWEIVNTRAHALVQFKIAKDSSQHKGLWRGLNEFIITGDVQLGDAIQAEIPVNKIVSFLEGHGRGDDMDLVHLCCLARCWEIR